MKKSLLFILCCLAFSGCYEAETAPDAKVLVRAAEFADAYFNYNFEKARKMVTPESEKWLRFAASNVTQEDVDLLNTQEESATVEAVDYERTNDSTLVVTVAVRNFLKKDSLGKEGVIADEATFFLTAVQHGGDFLIRMEGLPRSERQSRD